MDWSPLWISIQIAITATGITIGLGILCAWRVYRSERESRKLLDVFLTLPLVLPPTVAGFLLLVLFGKSGFLGRPLLQMGIQIIFTRTAAVIAAVVISFPLMYRSAKAAFEQVDRKLVHAARTLGMTEFSIFYRIILPLALQGVISGGILSFARALGEFGATLMIAGNIPGITQTMPQAIYMSLQGGRTEEATVWVIILLLLSFVMILSMNAVTLRKMKWERKPYEHIRTNKEKA